MPKPPLLSEGHITAFSIKDISLPHPNLVGTWELKRWYNEDASGQRFFPFGENVSGYISYSPDGFVFVHMSVADRPNYADADPFTGTPEEHQAAMISHITYAGKYTQDGDVVTHHVTQASCPNWVGSKQVRQVELDGDKLALSASGTRFQGHDVTAYVDWVRAKA